MSMVGRRAWGIPRLGMHLDPGHPLSTGLTFAAYENTVIWPQHTLSVISTFTEASPLGGTWTPKAYIDAAGFPQQTDDTCFTLAAYFPSPSTYSSGQREGVGFRSGDGQYSIRIFRSGGNIYPRYDSAGAQVGPGSATDTRTQGGKFGVLTKSGLTLTFYTGSSLTSATRTTGQLDCAATTCRYGAAYSVFFAMVCGGWFWSDRALTHNEICMLQANPFGMFKTP